MVHCVFIPLEIIGKSKLQDLESNLIICAPQQLQMQNGEHKSFLYRANGFQGLSECTFKECPALFTSISAQGIDERLLNKLII